MLKKFLHLSLLVSIMLSLLAVTPVTSARASGSIVVNTNADNTVSDLNCTLREAIIAANTDTAYHGCPAGAGTDTITFNADYTITLNNLQLPKITSPIIITGNGQTKTMIQAAATAGTASKRILYIAANGNLTLNKLTLRNGRCAGACDFYLSEGGAIFIDGGKLVLSNVALTGNSTIKSTVSESSGGAIYSKKGILTIINSAFSNNTSYDSGGALVLYNSTTNIKNSTFNANTANRDVSPQSSSGGAITMIGNGTTSTLNISNSTFSGNSTTGSGGAIAQFSNPENGSGPGGTATTTVTNATIVENHANDFGGLYTYASATSTATIKLFNSIVYGNTASGAGPNCGTSNATIVANSKNLFENVSDCPAGVTDIKSSIPLSSVMDALAGNGGSTQTRALTSSSPALDAGKDTTCAATPINNLDQRGKTRLQGAHCDIGAYEHQTTELLQNGGFNSYPDNTIKIPTNWVQSNLNTATDGKNTVAVQEGAASVKIFGTGAVKTISQRVGVSGLTGDKLTFSFWVRGSAIPSTGSGACRGQVVFYLSAATVGTKTIACPTGTYAFQQKILSISAPGTFDSAEVIFTYSRTSGSVWLDAASLTK